MSRLRIVVATVITLALGGTAVWQVQRERQIAACAAAGGAWNGALSLCEAKRPIILERDGLKRG